MKLKHVLLALMVTYSCDAVLTHFTSSGHHLPLLACMRTMDNIIQNVLCSQYEQYSPESYSGLPALPINSWEIRDRTIRSCCLRPCSVSELMSIC